MIYEQSNLHLLFERQKIKYSKVERKLIKFNCIEFFNQCDRLDYTRQSVIFPNQDETSDNIFKVFKKRGVINVLVIAKTQSGKTGCMRSLIEKFVSYYYKNAKKSKKNKRIVPTENIYIITGLSDLDWKEQTKERLPAILHDRIYHRNELLDTEKNLLDSFVKEIKNKKNVLIIMDEVQVACMKNQTLYKAFNDGGLFDKQLMYENDVKIVEFTATPDGTLYDLENWKDVSVKILAQPGDGYVGSKELLENGRVKQFKDLCENSENKNQIHANIREIKNVIEEKYKKKPLYHIIRAGGGAKQDKTIQNFKHLFPENEFEYQPYNSITRVEKINAILKKTPRKHTFIFIKEMFRCAKTLNKENLGIVYERYVKNPSDSTIIQGLIGRITGYDDNGFSICFTNVDTIERYEKLWNCSFKDQKIKWNSNTTVFKKKIKTTVSKTTLYHTDHFDGFSSDDSVGSVVSEIEYKIYNSLDEARQKFKVDIVPTLKINHPNKKRFDGPRDNKNPNKDGFYESNIDRETKVRSLDETKQYRAWALNEDHCYTFNPCYTDPSDRSTLQWVYFFKKVKNKENQENDQLSEEEIQV